MARCTYIVNKKDEPASKNFVKNYAKVSIHKLNIERAYMPLNRLFNTVGGVIEPKQ